MAGSDSNRRLGPVGPTDPPKRRCSECSEVTRIHDKRDLCKCEREAADLTWRLEDEVRATDPALCPECHNIVEPEAPPVRDPDPGRHGELSRRVTCPTSGCSNRGSYTTWRLSGMSAVREGFVELWTVDGVDLSSHFEAERLRKVHDV